MFGASPAEDILKILTLNHNQKLIGTYGRCFYFSRELARHGHEVTMVTVSRDSLYRPKVYFKKSFLGEYERPEGEGPWFRIIEGPALGHKWLPGWGSGPLDIAARIKEILGGDYDAIYGFEYQPNVSWPLYLTRILKKYVYFSDWCDWYAGNSNRLRGIKMAHKIDAFFEERIRFLARRLTVTSKALYERAQRMGIPNNRITKISQGIDPEYYACLDKDEMRTRLGFDQGRPIVVAVNDWDMVREIQIFQKVLKAMPDALFIALGNVKENARAAAMELGINASVYFTGWVKDEDYPRYVACGDVCFLPLADNLNNRARFPGKILDFLSAGRAVVTNDVGEVGELFRTRRVGVLAGQDNDDFAHKLVELLKNPEEARSLGQNARKVILKEWDWRIRGEQIARVVQSEAA